MAAVGRPLKFNSVEELQEKIDSYFNECDPHIKEYETLVFDSKAKKETTEKRNHFTKQIPYTITGLAVHLDTSRETLLDYEDKEEYSDTIKRAKDRIHAFAELRLFENNPTGVIFNLKNNFGWKDKTETDITTKGESINPDTLVAEDFAKYLKDKKWSAL